MVIVYYFGVRQFDQILVNPTFLLYAGCTAKFWINTLFIVYKLRHIGTDGQIVTLLNIPSFGNCIPIFNKRPMLLFILWLRVVVLIPHPVSFPYLGKLPMVVFV